MAHADHARPSPPQRTLLGSVFWLPWSVVAWVLTFSWMSLLTISSLPLMVFIPFERFQLKFHHPALGRSVHFALSRLRVFVDPAYDRERVSVFVQNHVSMLDAVIACGTIRVPLCGLENASHLRVPGYGWLMRCANAIPVDRKKRNFRKDIETALRERASRGISILTFPEAHRTLDGSLRPFKRGVFLMARDAGIPIVPICVRGAYRLLPKGAITMRPTTVEVYIAPQIETKGLSDEQVLELMERVRRVQQAWIERKEMLGELCRQPIGDHDAAGSAPITNRVAADTQRDRGRLASRAG